VIEAAKAGEREVEFRFDQKGNRELPQIMGDLPVLPALVGRHGRKRQQARRDQADA
jgi:hypothetical protein